MRTRRSWTRTISWPSPTCAIWASRGAESWWACSPSGTSWSSCPTCRANRSAPMPFPQDRLRRLRATAGFRRLVRETRLSVDNLIAPFFVLEGRDGRQPIASMPGQWRAGGGSLLKIGGGGRAPGGGAVVFPGGHPPADAPMSPPGLSARSGEGGAPPRKWGARQSYQMDPANLREALREIELDIQEGADIVMIKPALPYLDVVHAARQAFNRPIAAYQVSGEYSMIKAAAQLGWLDERRAMLETLLAIHRAGADLILTYFAKEAARALHE